MLSVGISTLCGLMESLALNGVHSHIKSKKKKNQDKKAIMTAVASYRSDREKYVVPLSFG